MTQRIQDKTVFGILIGMIVALCCAAVPVTVQYLTTYDTMADLAAYGNPQSFLKSAHVRGYFTPGDGGGGTFYATNSVTSTNLGTRIKAIVGSGLWSWDRMPNEAITPLHFGAKGDGTSDDTAVISAWMSVAWPLGHSLGGKTYAFDSITPAVSGRDFFGPGTFKKRTAATNIWMIWTGSRIKFRDLTFDANHATKTLCYIDNYMTNWSVINCTVKGVQNNSSVGATNDVVDGFLMTRGVRDCLFQNNRFSDFDSTYSPSSGNGGIRCIRAGIGGTTGTDWTNDRFDKIRILDSDFEDIGPTQLDSDPICLQNQVPDANGDQICDFIIRGCHFKNQGRRAIKCEVGGGIIEGNDIYSSLTGTVATTSGAMFSAISFYGPVGTLRGNKIHGGSYQYGIEVAWLATFGQPHGVVVEGNTILFTMATRLGSYGIILKGCKQCTVTGNTVYGADVGIDVAGDCQDVSLANNNTDHIGTYGILVQTLASGSASDGTPDTVNISGGVVNSDQYSIFLSAGTSIDVENVKGAATTQFFFRNTGLTGMNFFGKRVESVTTDQAVTSTATLTDATGLVVTISANKKYRYRAVLFIDNAGTTAGLKFALTGPSSPTKVTLAGILENSTSTILHQAATAYATIIDTTIATTGVKYAVIEGTVFNGANAGDLKVQFAQHTSDASATTLKAGSFLEVERLN